MLEYLQKIGKALMLPIAVLPAAALLLRLGVLFSGGDAGQGFPGLAVDTPLLAVWKVMALAGDTVFGALPILFAVGVAVGLTEGSGVAALGGTVGILILNAINKQGSISDILNATPDAAPLKMGVFGGIIIGVVAAWAYNNYKDMKLPSYLGFFAGRRFVPIITALASVGVGIVAAVVWPPIGAAIQSFGDAIVTMGAIGLILYGFANRMLLLVGLHHILNTFVWFQLGSFTKADGTVVNGDLNRFFAGDPTAGPFMAGWFVVMMFGLPAAAYAIYQAADKSEKKATGSIMGSAGFTSFLTGITEPIEFSFAYAAPALFAVHGLLAGVALAICAQLDWVQGFGFSAGLIDYLLNFTLASNASAGGSTGPLGILGLGVVFAALYYVLFAAVIKSQNLATPGRTPVKGKAKGRR
jgi:PTS system N-acetylglucosamine-specific IIC component